MLVSEVWAKVCETVEKNIVALATVSSSMKYSLESEVNNIITGELLIKKACPFEYGEVVDVLLQTKRNTAAAVCFFKRILRSVGCSPKPINSEVIVPFRENLEGLGNMIHRSIQITAVNNHTGQLEVKSGA